MPHGKDSFSAKSRPDLVTFPEFIACDAQLDTKKYFSVIAYTSPSQSQIEFQYLINTFELMLSKMSGENPYSVIITGRFNCSSTNWWEDDIENYEGKRNEPFTPVLGLHQLINELMPSVGNSRSCIDVILTYQPNLFLESGVHPSLDGSCRHQIVYGKLSVMALSPLRTNIGFGFFDSADVNATKKVLRCFHGEIFHQTLHVLICKFNA